MIGARTTAAWQAAKERGVTPGHPRLAEVRGEGVETNKVSADPFAANILIEPRRAEGASLRHIADALDERRVPTARGGRRAQTQIADSLKRVG